MRLGCAYNIFDGIELLEYSIKSIRTSVDFICVIYQDISNFGNSSKIDSFSLLNKMKDAGLIDEIVKYIPNTSLKGHGNEIAKRNLGLVTCKNHTCTHFMTIDCDEFYIKVQFDAAKKRIIEGGFDSSACQMQTYYKVPEVCLNPPEAYYVPFIYRIDERKFDIGTKWPVIADPTRRLLPKNILIFDRSELEMHHYSYVRMDIRTKLLNSSANTNFLSRIEEIAKHHDNWTDGDKALLAGKEKRLYDTKKVENYFKIKL